MQMEIGIFAYKPFQLVADKAHQKNISVFGLEPFRDKKQKLGGAIDESRCQKIEYSISKSNRHSNLIIKEEIPINEAVYITSGEKNIIGFGLMSRQFNNTVQEVLSPAHIKGNGKLLYRCRR